MDTTPMVSVIIPSYNHARFISECIQSVLDQSFQDFEIIITDDASSDNSTEIIERFSDHRIKLFKHFKNRGACVASNNCIKNASGKYIAMLSSDDIWYPQKLKAQVDFLENNPNIAVVFGKVDWIDEAGEIRTNEDFPYLHVFDVENRSRFQWLNHFFSKGNCLCHPCSLIRKECYQEVGLLNPSLASIPDLDLWIRISLKFDIHILDEKLIKFRRMNDESNASGNVLHNQIRNQFEYQQILSNYLKINDRNELLQVFPELCSYDTLYDELIPFYLGQLAIQTNYPFSIQWGLELIFKLMLDSEKATLLQKAHDFDYIDFIKLSGEADPFSIRSLTLLNSILTHKTIISIDSQRGFKDNLTSLTKQYLKDLQSLIRSRF